MKLTILIPCYNGGNILKNNLPKLFDCINSDKTTEYEIVVVNDGSKDNTYKILKDIKGITLLSYDKNKGKGGAVQYGINHLNKCDAILIMDCDFAISLDSIKGFVNQIANNDIVIASRFSKDSVITTKRPLKRKIMSKCCNIFVNFMFRFHLKDTQCGFKCIKYDLAKLIASKQKINGWAFDVEYLYIAKLNNKKIKDIPVTFSENGLSTVSAIKSSINFIKSIFKIKRNKKSYISK